MENLKMMVMKFILKKYALGYLVTAWEKLKGNKTVLCIIGMILIPIAQTHGMITPEQADTLNAICGTGAGFSFMQKLQRYKPLLDQVGEAVKESKAENQQGSTPSGGSR